MDRLRVSPEPMEPVPSVSPHRISGHNSPWLFCTHSYRTAQPRHLCVGVATTCEVPAPKTPAQNRHRQAFMLLTLLTCSVSVCWSPPILFHLVVNYFHITTVHTDRTSDIIFTLQPIADPIFFALAITDLGDAILKTLKIWGCCSARYCRERLFKER